MTVDACGHSWYLALLSLIYFYVLFRLTFRKYCEAPDDCLRSSNFFTRLTSERLLMSLIVLPVQVLKQVTDNIKLPTWYTEVCCSLIRRFVSIPLYVC
jgi:hypothetical protein